MSSSLDTLPKVTQEQMNAMMNSNKTIAFPPHLMPENNPDNSSSSQQNNPVNSTDSGNDIFATGNEFTPEQPEQPEQDNGQEQIQSEVLANTQAPMDTQSSEKPSEDYSRETNLRIIRKRAQEAARIERERDEIAKQLREYKEREMLQRQTYEQPRQNIQQSYPDIGEQDLVEGRHYHELRNEIKALKQELQSTQNYSREEAIQLSLKQQYNDFESVVTDDNIETLKIVKPSLAAALSYAPLGREKGDAVYESIKEYVLPLLKQEENKYMENKRIQDNAKKPRSIASVPAGRSSNSPMSESNRFANGLTSDLQSQLWKEMQTAMKKK